MYEIPGDVPVGIVKVCVDSYISVFTKTLNILLEAGCFPNQHKLAEVNPVFEKEDELNKENYYHVSVFSHASKIFERIIFNQINLFSESASFELLTGCRKSHSTQNALLNVIEKWEHTLDKGN